MAWRDGHGRARWWVGAAMWAGCSAPNPAYEGDGTGAQTQDDGTTTGTIALTSTTELAEGTLGNEATTAADEAGSESGAASCEDAEAGIEVVVRPTAGVPDDLCGSALEGIGLLELTGAGYVLNLAPDCSPGEPVPLVFSPKGPSWSSGTAHCVHFEIRYRSDCSFESASIRDVMDDVLVYAASAIVVSPVPELAVERGEPVVPCECSSRGPGSCCNDAPAPGAYTLRATTPSGETEALGQGEQTTFLTPAGMYELAVTQARATNDCEDPTQFDWYYRQLGG